MIDKKYYSPFYINDFYTIDDFELSINASDSDFVKKGKKFLFSLKEKDIVNSETNACLKNLDNDTYSIGMSLLQEFVLADPLFFEDVTNEIIGLLEHEPNYHYVASEQEKKLIKDVIDKALTTINKTYNKEEISQLYDKNIELFEYGLSLINTPKK